MKIKNIRDFRTYYKEKVNDLHEESRVEHFLGQKKTFPNGKNIYGFFHIYHGDKADIRRGSFLTSFLDMAKDSQVLYEFLQNAVDADSTHFCMYYDDDYLLVMNNGKQFDFEGVRSLLNVGSSTKDSRSDIGKFGIGFKLVHRLIGENSGIEELTQKHLGPVIFSWAKRAQLKELISLKSIDEIQPAAQNYKKITGDGYEMDRHECGNSDPWLFKILVTNFPCQPNEKVFDINYQKRDDLFASQELMRLTEWLNKYKGQIDLKKFEQGSLFFIKLGKGKRSYLERENLEHGAKFSLSVLNKSAEASGKKGLRNVFLNSSEQIEPVDLEFEKILIPYHSPDYEYISPWQDEGSENRDIEMLFGYCRDYKISTELIKGFPNFYLFFPLDDEVHNLNFILHSNAFYNGSHRSSLHVGGDANDKSGYGINERLLEICAEKLTEKLEVYKKKDKERFKSIYATLLLSGKAKERHKRWIDQPLYEALLAYLRENIPTQSTDENWCLPIKNVRIKNTALDIQPTDLGIAEIEWFHWTDDLLVQEASLFTKNGNEKTDSKLSLKAWTVRDIIEALSNKHKMKQFNKWVEKNEKEDKDAYYRLLVEINDNIGYNPPAQFMNKFLRLKLFKFADAFYSINELAQDANKNKLFCLDHTQTIEHELTRIGFIFSDIDISDDRFRRIKFNIEKRLLYLQKDAILLELIQDAVKSKANELDTDQKKKMLSTFIDQFDRRILDRLPELTLFCDMQGAIKPLGQLLPYSPDQYPTWMHSYQIKADEYFPELQENYLMQDKHILERIIYPEWEALIDKPEIRNNMVDFEDEVIEYLLNIPQITVKQDENYDDGTFQHKIFDIAIKCLMDRENEKLLEEFKRKIHIELTAGGFIKIENILDNYIVNFDIAELGMLPPLNLSKILLHFTVSSGFVDNLLDQFTNFKNKVSLRNTIFKPRVLEKHSMIFDELKKRTTVLQNAHQLAFLILYAISNSHSKKNFDILNGFEIKTLAGNRELVNGCFVTQNFSFIAPALILNGYFEINNLLSLNSDRWVLHIAEKPVICYQPNLHNATYYCPAFAANIAEELSVQKAFFFELFNKWRTEKPAEIEINVFEHGMDEDDQLSYNSENIHLLIGFRPQNIVYSPAAPQNVNPDALPLWAQEWLKDDSDWLKHWFLKAIGVKIEDSMIGKLEDSGENTANSGHEMTTPALKNLHREAKSSKQGTHKNKTDTIFMRMTQKIFNTQS